MKSPEELSKVQRMLSVSKGTRMITGILAIVSTLYMIVCAVVALNRQEDTWLAMKWPLIIAFVLLVVFVRSTKKILEYEAILRQ